MVDWKKEYKASDLFKRDKGPTEDEQAPAAPAEGEDEEEPKLPWYK